MFFHAVVSLQVSFDVLACGDNSKLQFRCYFGETGEYSIASYLFSKNPPDFQTQSDREFPRVLEAGFAQPERNVPVTNSVRFLEFQ